MDELPRLFHWKHGHIATDADRWNQAVNTRHETTVDTLKNTVMSSGGSVSNANKNTAEPSRRNLGPSLVSGSRIRNLIGLVGSRGSMRRTS